MRRTMLSSWCRNVRALRSNARTFTDLVCVVEVGPRDGLQNIKQVLPAETKIELINQLSETGVRSIEVTSFVSPKWVPQMGDNEQVYRGICQKEGVDYPVLVPNVKGLCKALELGAKEVVLFTAASETFNRKNINCSIADSLKNCQDMRDICKENSVKTRAVISCIAGCPYEGDVAPAEVARIAEALLEMGCYEVGLGDTVGVATPKKMAQLFDELKKVTCGDLWRFAVHCHDTYGQAIGNIYESLNQGIRVFDSSIAGLGGCPYAPGASGNVSTEDLVYLLNGQGMETGIDLEKLIRVGDYISQQIPAPNNSRVGNAFLAKEKRNEQKQAQC